MFHVPEKNRIEHPIMGIKPPEGFPNNGAFKIKSPLSDRVLYIIASDGEGWEHVSVHALSLNRTFKLPTHEEMCFIKDTFWDEEDVVVHYYPRKSEYVNIHETTLHLWRATEKEFPTPPVEFV